jgi:hypothetical protein
MKNYKFNIFIRIVYKLTINIKINRLKKILNFDVFKTFINGLIIIKIKPNKLVIKNLG